MDQVTSSPRPSAVVSAAGASPASGNSDAIQVVVVDDSAVIRGLVKRWIDETDGLEVVGSCSNGKQAVDTVAKVKPHVVILDIEMPEMDGLEALPGIAGHEGNYGVNADAAKCGYLSEGSLTWGHRLCA